MKNVDADPYISAIREILESMVGISVTVSSLPATYQTERSTFIIGLVSFSGSTEGIIALRFPEEVAIAIIGQLAGVRFESVDSSVIDGVGEIVSMVAGCAKRQLHGDSVSMSFPTVVRGDIRHLSRVNDSRWAEYQLKTVLGEFGLIVIMKAIANQKPEVASEGTRR